MFYLSWAFPFSALYSLVFSLSLGLRTLSVIATFACYFLIIFTLK